MTTWSERLPDISENPLEWFQASHVDTVRVLAKNNQTKGTHSHSDGFHGFPIADAFEIPLGTELMIRFPSITYNSRECMRRPAEIELADSDNIALVR